MHTLKKFIQYYGPYKGVFFLDLICAAVISLVDLAFPQILRILNEDLIYGEFFRNPASFIADGSDFVCNVFDSDRM